MVVPQKGWENVFFFQEAHFEEAQKYVKKQHPLRILLFGNLFVSFVIE
jgi:hypothetical protein